MVTRSLDQTEDAMANVRTEREGPVLTVILDRPDVRNAVDGATARELVAAFEQLETDESLLAGVLWGTGESFCAGADLKAVAAGEHSVDPRQAKLSPQQFVQQMAPMGPSRMMLSKPVIAAIAGHAVAGGLELALWCDLRVAEQGAVLGVYCRRWGVPLIDGGTVRLPQLIGLSRALDLILTGRGVPADEALAMGLVNRVVPAGESRRAAAALAAELCRFPPACLRTDRDSAYRSFASPWDEALRREFAEGCAVLASEAIPGAQRFADGAGRHGAF